MRIETAITRIAAVSLLLVAGAAGAASVDGANIHWNATRKGPQTAVFVHGWTCDDTSSQSQVPVLSKSYRGVPDAGVTLSVEARFSF